MRGNMYDTTSIKEIAELLIWNKKNGYKTSVLIGSGVSATAGIPTASGFINIIKNQFPERCTRCGTDSYHEYMSILTPNQRRKIINDIINKSKINAAHLYLSLLVQNEYIDRILTTNFDTLVAKSFSLQNIFPGVYDFAASQNFIPGEAAEISVFHLHGQKDGFVLLNTQEEVNKHYEKLKDVFDESLTKRTLIVIGYSGTNDPVFRHLAEVKKFENQLFWIGYEENDPEKHIEQEILLREKYASFLKGYNADSFFIELKNELTVDDVMVFSKPFTFLDNVINNISDFRIDDQDVTPTKETKKWISFAKRIFEDREEIELVKKDIDRTINDDELVKLSREAWINNSFDKFEEISFRIKSDSPLECKKYLSFLLNNWGCEFLHQAKGSSEKEKLLNEAKEKFNKSIILFDNNDFSMYNLGITLSNLAELKSDETLYRESFEKFSKAVELNPKNDSVFYNWGMALSDLAKLKSDENILRLSIPKFISAENLKEGSASYNLACVNCLINEIDEAYKWLLKSLEFKTAPSIKHIIDDADLDLIKKDDKFKQLIEKYFQKENE